MTRLQFSTPSKCDAKPCSEEWTEQCILQMCFVYAVYPVYCITPTTVVVDSIYVLHFISFANAASGLSCNEIHVVAVAIKLLKIT